MKRVFMPIVRVVQWFGKLLRAFWKGKKTNDAELSSERVQNGQVGLSVIAIAVAIVGIRLSVRPTDIQRMEETMQQSFERMEKSDYLAGPVLDSSDYNIILRGKAKQVSSMLREEFDCFNQLDFSAFNESQIVPYCKQLLAGYMNTHTLMTSFETNAAAFLFKDSETDYTYSIYYVHFSQLVLERKELFQDLGKERKKMEEELGAIAKSKKVNKKKVAKICKQYVNSKMAMEYNQICFEEINVLYDCLVAMQLYETYGKQAMENDLLKTLLEGLKQQQNNNN